MVSKYVLKEDEAKHIHPRKTWAIGLSIEVGDEIENGGCVFPAIKAHIATAELEPTADVVMGEQGPQGIQGEPGAPGDATSWDRDIVPTGTKNGSNKSFTLPHSPDTNKIALYWNGQRMTATTDYTVSGTALTLVSFAPASTDAFFADYIF